tara:strand:+ start:2202 stop:2837 length:636 start_codon:yes stop_codon:yes gene_type:complete
MLKPYKFSDFYGYDQDCTSATAPTSVGVNVRGIEWNGFIADGTIGGDGGALGGVTAKGVVYSSSNTSPTIGGSGVTQISGGSGTATFSINVPAAGVLINSTTYYVRIYATNSVGTTYSSVFAAQTVRRPHVFRFATGKFGHAFVCNSTNTVTVYAQSQNSTNLVLQLQTAVYTSPTPNHSSQPSGLISYSDGNHKGRWTGTGWSSGFTESC